MDSDNRSPKDNKPNRAGSNPNFNWRSLILVAVFLGLHLRLLGGALRSRHQRRPNCARTSFSGVPKRHQIVQDEKHPLELISEEGSSTLTLRGFYSSVLPAKPETAQPFHTTINLDYDRAFYARMEKAGLYPNPRKESNVVATTLSSFCRSRSSCWCCISSSASRSAWPARAR